ncbi:TPA: hypothetical protein I4G69_001096 [Enterobacter asburiae]|nr:hypothetical protein [Enterobacter asburiae]
MSPRRPTPQELYFLSVERQQERERYNEFLTNRGYENNPDSAHLYTMSRGYIGMKARDPIVMLAVNCLTCTTKRINGPLYRTTPILYFHGYKNLMKWAVQ